MNIISLQGKTPQWAKDVFIASTATLIGDIQLKPGSSVWFGAVLRGDVEPIVIGAQSNIQDLCVVHGSWHKARTIVGDQVTVGHSVILHGCEIQNLCLIGMGSTVMDNAVIGTKSIVGAGSLITEGKIFPPESLIVGRPARVVRSLTAEEIKSIEESALHYSIYSKWYQDQK